MERIAECSPCCSSLAGNKFHSSAPKYSRSFLSKSSSASVASRCHRRLLPDRSFLRRNSNRRLLPAVSSHFSSLRFSFNSNHFCSLSLRAVASPTQQPDIAEVEDEVAEKFGFEKVSEEFIAEYKSKAVLFKHKKTGAKVMSLSNDDENKAFGIVFRAPPKDSTGIAHILEHCVLRGSRKYPLKDPLVELSKGSLRTYNSESTSADRTCFTVASTNTKGFYNHVDVYLDAVFFPKCIEDFQSFQQEGWHYELNDPSDDITYKGVVFNEMKGLCSQPDKLLARTAQQALFPDNTYGVDSGGDPQVIPKLTFEEFKEFHRKYYHPSNARIWFYGDDDP